METVTFTNTDNTQQLVVSTEFAKTSNLYNNLINDIGESDEVIPISISGIENPIEIIKTLNDIYNKIESLILEDGTSILDIFKNQSKLEEFAGKYTHEMKPIPHEDVITEMAKVIEPKIGEGIVDLYSCERYIELLIVIDFLQADVLRNIINSCIGFYWAKVQRETGNDDAHLMVLKEYEKAYGSKSEKEEEINDNEEETETVQEAMNVS